MPRSVAVIDPAVRVPELDCLNRMALRSPLPLTYHLPALFGLDSLARATDLAGIVILGSGASVHDDLPWQHALRDWLRPRIDGGTPILGLCYGHQLLAHLLGGEVGYVAEDRRKLVGLRTVHLAANPLWGEARAGALLVSHREHVVRVPEAFEVVGRSEAVAVDAIAHRARPIWGFQPHPEATPAFARNNGVPFDGPEETLAFGHGLVDRFLERCAGR